MSSMMKVVKDVIAEANASLNDMAYDRILRTLHTTIDSTTSYQKEQYYIMNGSAFDTDTTTESDSQDNHDSRSTIKITTKTPTPPEPPPVEAHFQSDSGANRIVVDDISLLENVKQINDTPMGGCNKDEVAIVCTAIGDLTIHGSNDAVTVKAYYSKDVDGVIISPTTMVTQHRDRYSGWMQMSNCDNSTGYIKLIGKDGHDDNLLTTYSVNDLWYHSKMSIGPSTPTIKRLSNAAKYELWHQRTGHAGTSTLEILHKHATGVPKLKGNTFYRCPSCMSGKLTTKQPLGKQRRKSKRSSKESAPMNNDKHLATTDQEEDDLHLPNALPGQHFHMDFGFVRGTDYHKKSEDGCTLTSTDGKNAYLAIIDRATRYMWVFLTDNKKPPIQAAQAILQKFKSNNPHRTVRVDQGGELGRSNDFKTMIGEEQFSLELTGSDSSAQNGMAERPNRTYGDMMRCLLHSSELGQEYWSYALLHAVYLKNRLPHHSINKSPYEAFTGIKPDLTLLRTFGSKIYAKDPGKRPFKLDHHSSKGIFIGFTASDKVVRYIDNDSRKVKTAAHVIFDEAHMTTDASKAPIAAQTLQRLGYSSKEDWITEEEEAKNDVNQPSIEHINTSLHVKLLTPTAITPSQSTPDSIGLDLHLDSSEDMIVEAGTIKALPTGIAIECPQHTYGRIAPRSGLTVKQHLTTMAGVIDPDYRGEIKVIMHNFGHEHQTLTPGQRIGQLILEKAQLPQNIITTNDLTTTMRDKQGFGSTEERLATPVVTEERKEVITNKPTSTKSSKPNDATPPPTILQHNIFHDVLNQHETAKAASLHDIHTTFEPPYKINISYDPYDNHTHRIMDIIKGERDTTFGLVIQQCKDRDLPILLSCKKGTSSAKIKRWRSEIKGAYITSINDNDVTSDIEIKRILHDIHRKGKEEKSIKIGLATISKQAMHPQFGVPQLYHEQLNIIGKHLWDIRNSPSWQKEINEEIMYPAGEDTIENILRSNGTPVLKRLKESRKWRQMKNLPEWYKIASLKKRKRLTRRYLLKQPDWEDWKKSEFKQLNQYESQGTFGPPQPLPQGANLLPLLWTYLIKDCGTKKARCVCNGSPRMRGSVTLADTYAGSLEQTGARIFWAASAINNNIVIGADASNAFAEAPAPKAPLFVTIDGPFREWYKEKYPDKPAIPKDHVLPVHGALQGHPESARLWAKLIDKVIKELNLQPCTHEPCLYYTNNYNNTGKTVLFLRQVDDFAVSCATKEIAQDVIKRINDKMTIDVKELGMIHRFNGVDVLQSKHFIKLYNKTYIEKVLQRHEWIKNDTKATSTSTPMISENDYQRKLETAPTPTDDEIKQLEKEMGFGYRQAIGELIYALCTCRPDISYPVIKLSQYSTKPQRIHFEAIKNIFRYLNTTKDDGIIYWRRKPRTDLPNTPLPNPTTDNNYKEEEIHERKQDVHNIMFGAVDSDYAGDVSHRRSVSGIILRIAGGTIFYKTKYQETHALSSTEAEFTAAAEAAKYILYVRSILEQIGLPQTEATVLYEDNQGALLMANAQQPTKRTRHMDIKTFAIQDWVEHDMLRLQRICTTDNYADVMTKATGRILFHRHMDYIMGKIKPAYVEI